MDAGRLDEQSRRLAGATTRRGALGILTGLAGGSALAGQAEGKRHRRKRRCNPACAAGQTCVKGTCICDDGGTRCGDACCTGTQTCQGGRCADPLPRCLAFGAACKNVGARCCDGLACGSGQGGKGDVACYVPAGGACGTTAECTYDSACKDGICVAVPPPTTTPPGPTCTVCASGCPFTTIEAAIAAATVGNEIVTVAAGTYTPVAMVPAETYLQIVRPLTLRACVPGEPVTIVCPQDAGLPFLCIVAKGQEAAVTVEGIGLEWRGTHGDDYDTAFTAIDGAAFTLRDVTASNFRYGVYAWSDIDGVLSTVTVLGTVAIVTDPSVPSAVGLEASTRANLAIKGLLSVTNAGIGLNDATGSSIVCDAGSTYTTSSVAKRCGPTCPGGYTGCACCS